MKLLVIEDEPLIASGLMNDLRILNPDAEIAGPLSSNREIREWFDKNNLPDLIFSDIQLSDGISFDALAEMAQACPIIFITAFDEYALKAFKVFSIDYLLKPVSIEDLQQAMDKYSKVVSKYENSEYWGQVKQMLQSRQSGKLFKERFMVHQGLKMILIQLPEVVGFVKQEIIFLIASNGQKYSTDYRSLDELDDILDPAKFFRTNRQCILHLPFIHGFKTLESGKLEVFVKDEILPAITVSKEKASEFRKWL